MTLQSVPTELPLITPFGANDWINFYQGFSSDGFGKEYATPVKTGGLRLSRHLMNRLGYESTIGSFLHSIGWQALWSEAIAKNVGGYPKGAVVGITTDRGTPHILRQYVNTVDNNTQPPPGASNVSADDVIKDTSEEVNGWQPLFSTASYNFFPNYDSKTLVGEFTVLPATPLNKLQVIINEPGWVLVTRTIDNWEDARDAFGALKGSEKFNFSQSNFVSLGFWDSQADQDESPTSEGMFSMLFNEGQTASRFMPCNRGVFLTGQCYNPVTSITIRVYRYDMETASAAQP